MQRRVEIENHLVAAAAHIGEPRECKNIGIIEPCFFWPVIGGLWFDDDQIFAVQRASEAVLQKPALG